MTVPASPLLDPASNLLDERQRSVVQRVSDAERAHILGLPSNDPLDAQLRARVLATGPELFAQPAAIRSTLQRNSSQLREIAARFAAGFDRVVLVGAGDSLAVMMASRLLLESQLGVPCEPVQSLEFAYFQAGSVNERTAVIALSSSGETTRTVEALLMAQHRKAYTVAVTNTVGSTLQAEADVSLVVQATRVGWPTQSSTAALALLFDLAVRAGERRRVDCAPRLRAALESMPDAMTMVLARLDDPIAGLADREVSARVRTVLFSGGGPSLASAVIGAAKVKECTALLRAEVIQVEEYHHYNSQKAGEPLVLIAPTGWTVPRAVDTGRDAHRWGGRLHVVTTDGETAFDQLEPETTLRLPAGPEELSALLTVLPAQLIGYHLGLSSYAQAVARHRSPGRTVPDA